MELKEVQEFIKSNQDKPEVQDYIKGFITPDGVKNYLDTDDGMKIVQPKLDAHFTKSLETWKANNVQKMIDAEVQKAITARYPEDTPEQKRMKQLEQDFAKEKASRIRSEMLMKAVTKATSKGLPAELVGYLVGQDEDSTEAAMTTYEKAWKESLAKAVEDRFKKFGRVPEKSSEGDEGLYTRDEVAKMSQTQVKLNMEKILKSTESW